MNPWLGQGFLTSEMDYNDSDTEVGVNMAIDPKLLTVKDDQRLSSDLDNDFDDVIDDAVEITDSGITEDLPASIFESSIANNAGVSPSMIDSMDKQIHHSSVIQEKESFSETVGEANPTSQDANSCSALNSSDKVENKSDLSESSLSKAKKCPNIPEAVPEIIRELDTNGAERVCQESETREEPSNDTGPEVVELSSDLDANYTKEQETVETWKIDYIRVESVEDDFMQSNIKTERPKELSQINRKPKNATKMQGGNEDKNSSKSNGSRKRKLKNDRKMDKVEILDERSQSQSKKTKMHHENEIVQQTQEPPDWGNILQLPVNEHFVLVKKLLFNKNRSRLYPNLKRLGIPESELNICPGCQDSFLLPTTFFQHIYRKSVFISYKCKECQKNLQFFNKCHLRIHLLSHIDVDKMKPVYSEYLDVTPLSKSQVDCNVENVMVEYRKHAVTMPRSTEICQCMECMSLMQKHELSDHLQKGSNLFDVNLQCKKCDRYFVSECSYTSHSRIHRKEPPYVCPECGQEFLTWNIFKVHLSRSCLHDSKTVLFICEDCNDPNQIYCSFEELFLHLMENHIKHFIKCSKCPRAFKSVDGFQGHLAKFHVDSGEATHSELYKFPGKRSTQFFRNQDSMQKYIESEYSIKALFGFKCNFCGLNFREKPAFLEHVSTCSHDFTKDAMYMEKPLEDKHVEILDDLRRVTESSQCKGCLKQSKNFKTHIFKYHSTTDVTEVKTQPNDFNEESQARETQITKRQNLVGKVDYSRKLRKSFNERQSVHTTPLKMTIKLSGLEDGKKLQIISPTAAADNLESHSELENKTHKKSNTSNPSTTIVKVKSKAKSNDPQKLFEEVQSLGMDVPTRQNLLVLNHIGHSNTAFSQGSVVKQKATVNKCLVCHIQFASRSKFQEHIAGHRQLEDSHQCKECGASFASEPSWQKHLLLVHKIRKPSPDMYCEDLVSPDQVIAHVANGDSGGNMEGSDSESERLVIDTGE